MAGAVDFTVTQVQRARGPRPEAAKKACVVKEAVDRGEIAGKETEAAL